MRLVVQRVTKANVEVDGRVVGEIGKGYLVLVGVSVKDTVEEANFLAEKLFKLRIMADEDGKMNLSITDAKGEVLIVSQFTLYADTSGGNRPSFIHAAKEDEALDIYNHFVEEIKKKGVSIKTGIFGAYMEINSVLDGPVTIILES